MTDVDFEAALYRAHVQGDGRAVADIWRKVANGDLTDVETLTWAKAVGEWITSVGSAPRVAHIHAALAVSGWAEPSLDSLSDEHLLLKLAMENSNLTRTAATAVWTLIASGKASQGTREQWLDFVAKGVSTEVKLRVEPKRRGERLISQLGLSGKLHEMDVAFVRTLLPYLIGVPKDVHSRDARGHTVALRKRLQAICVIPEGLTQAKAAKWDRVIRDAKRDDGNSGPAAK